MAAQTVRRHVVISGRVQGVWFRESMRQTADRHGVAGWVRNTADGTVEAVLEGPRDRVDRVLDWCAIGPPDARVDGVTAAAEMPEGLRSFSVR